VVLPPWAQWMMWWASHHRAGTSHPGWVQPPSRRLRARRSAGCMDRRASPAAWGSPASSMAMGVMVASQARRRAVSAVMGPVSRSMRPSPASSARLRARVTWGRSPFWVGRSLESRWRRQISTRASARRWAGVRESSLPRAQDSASDPMAVVTTAPDSGSRSPSRRTMPSQVADTHSRRRSKALAASTRAPSGSARRRQCASALGNTRADRLRAWETSSRSSRANTSGAASRASTSRRTRHSDRSPAVNACRVCSMCCRARATLTRLRQTAGGSPVAAISQAVGEAKPCA